MREVMEAYPGAQRAMFRRYHIGGCSQCAFQPDETLQQVCERNGKLDATEVLGQIESSHAQDSAILISATELAQMLKREPDLRVVDVRSREEFEAVHLPDRCCFHKRSCARFLERAPTPACSC